MPHATIAGQTASGKTYAGISLASAAYDRGQGVLVLHKELEPWPKASWQTHDPEAFLAMFWKARNCVAFMELSDADVGKYDDRFHKCFSKGRHAGHRCFFLTQYPANVHPIIRSNCHSIWLYSSAMNAAKIWAEEFNDSKLLDAPNLPQFHCIYKPSRFAPAYVTKFP